MFLKRLAVACLAITAIAVPASAEFPEGQIDIIVPFGAGGGSDRVARTVDKHWQEATGEGFNFIYQPGAAGAVGTTALSRATADGQTIAIVNMPNLVIQPVSGAATFSLEDFTYIGQVNSDPIALVVPTDSKYQSLDDLLADAKENPGVLTLAITGALGTAHIAALDIMKSAEAQLTLVPTQGGANTVARVAGGHVTAGIIGLGLQTQQENLRALAVSGDERSEFTPDVPTFLEAGVETNMQTTRVILAPAGIPDEARDWLRETLSGVVQSDAFIEESRQSALAAVWIPGDELEAQVMAKRAVIEELLRENDLLK